MSACSSWWCYFRLSNNHERTDTIHSRARLNVNRNVVDIFSEYVFEKPNIHNLMIYWYISHGYIRTGSEKYFSYTQLEWVISRQKAKAWWGPDQWTSKMWGKIVKIEKQHEWYCPLFRTIYAHSFSLHFKTTCSFERMLFEGSRLERSKHILYLE